MNFKLFGNSSSVISKLWAYFCSIVIFILSIIGGPASNSDNVRLVSTDRFCLDKTLYFSQGISTDGKYYYTSASIAKLGINGIAKFTVDGMKLEKYKMYALPSEFVNKYGSNHIGGISYYNGKIYGAIEDKTRSHPMIIVFDADTLEFSGEAYLMPHDQLTTGIPWCAVDAEKGLLYTSLFDNVNEIFAYNIKDMSYSHSIKLNQTLNHVQGGEVYNGKIYLSIDNKDTADETIFSVEISSGNVVTEFERSVRRFDNEAEGMTVYPMPDGSLFHVIDYDMIVGVNLRHYAPA